MRKISLAFIFALLLLSAGFYNKAFAACTFYLPVVDQDKKTLTIKVEDDKESAYSVSINQGVRDSVTFYPQIQSNGDSKNLIIPLDELSNQGINTQSGNLTVNIPGCSSAGGDQISLDREESGGSSNPFFSGFDNEAFQKALAGMLDELNPYPGCNSEGLSYTICPYGPDDNQQPLITGATSYVKITFKDIPESEDLHLCHFTDIERCAKKDLKKKPKDDNREDGITVIVCAKKDDELKGEAEEKGDDGDECDVDDYFHEGHIYRLSLFEDEEAVNLLGEAEFYVQHFFPDVSINGKPVVLNQKIQLPLPDSPLDVDIADRKVRVKLKNIRAGKNQEKRNNYQISIEGLQGSSSLYREYGCLPLVGGDEEKELEFPKTEARLGIGTYVIKINDLIKEDSSTYKYTDCTGGFTYYEIVLKTYLDSEGGYHAQVVDIIKDPEGIDGYLEGKLNPPPVLPCVAGTDENGEKITLSKDLTAQQQKTEGRKIRRCDEVALSLGISASTDPSSFISFVFSLVLGISGGIAIILIIAAGYRLVVSQGNPDQIKGAREQLTSAVVGLLFILFSFVILEVIGVDILAIPGFGS